MSDVISFQDQAGTRDEWRRSWSEMTGSSIVGCCGCWSWLAEGSCPIANEMILRTCDFTMNVCLVAPWCRGGTPVHTADMWGPCCVCRPQRSIWRQRLSNSGTADFGPRLPSLANHSNFQARQAFKLLNFLERPSLIYPKTLRFRQMPKTTRVAGCFRQPNQDTTLKRSSLGPQIVRRSFRRPRSDGGWDTKHFTVRSSHMEGETL